MPRPVTYLMEYAFTFTFTFASREFRRRANVALSVTSLIREQGRIYGGPGGMAPGPHQQNPALSAR